MIKWLRTRWFMYKLHRLHWEPVWLAAWRACKRRARLGTAAYWKDWDKRYEAGEFVVGSSATPVAEPTER